MKAIIQFEIPDSKDSQKDKEKLIQDIVNIVDEWLKGERIINIDFIQTYENNKTNDFIDWEADTTLN
jgi:hypothetical protein